MAYVSMFVYSEDVTMDNSPLGQKAFIVNPQHVFIPMFVPGMFSFAVSFGVLDVDTSKNHTIRYIFTSPNDEKPLIDTGAVGLPINKDENLNLPQDMRGLIINMNFRNVPFKIEGEYKSKIFLDGTSIGIYPIKVRGKERNDN